MKQSAFIAIYWMIFGHISFLWSQNLPQTTVSPSTNAQEHQATQNINPSTSSLQSISSALLHKRMQEDKHSWTGWRVIETPHFRVHFPTDLARLGRLAATMCEQAWQELTPLYNIYPKVRVEVALVDVGDQPNGYATAVAWPRMVFFTAPPAFDSVLHHYDDWLKILINHEFTHILQINQIAGASEWINHIIGQQIIPNQGLPSALLEGGATWAESISTGKGRVHSAMVQGHLRAQVIDAVLPSVDEWLNEPARWPGVATWYLHGGVFHDWLTQKYGTHWIKAWHQDISTSLVAFHLNRSFERQFGKTLYQLFSEWKTAYYTQTQHWFKVRAPLTSTYSWITASQRQGHPRLDRAGGVWVWQGQQGQSPGIYYYPPLQLRSDQYTPVQDSNQRSKPNHTHTHTHKVQLTPTQSSIPIKRSLKSTKSPLKSIKTSLKSTKSSSKIITASKSPIDFSKQVLEHSQQQGRLVMPLSAMAHLDLCFNRWGQVKRLIWDQNAWVEGRYSQTIIWSAQRLQDGTWSRPYRRSHEQRIRHPSCLPEGRWATVIEVVAGRSRLSLLSLFGDEKLMTLYDPQGLNQIGRAAIYPYWQSQSRSHYSNKKMTHVEQEFIDIVAPLLLEKKAYLAHFRVYAEHFQMKTLWPKTTHLLRKIPLESLAIHPTFTPDGQWLIYAKPQDGAYDLFKRPWPSLTPEIQVTRLATGALSPSVSQNYLAYESIESQGRGVAVIPTPLSMVPPIHQSSSSFNKVRYHLNNFSAPLPLSPLQQSYLAFNRTSYKRSCESTTPCEFPTLSQQNTVNNFTISTHQKATHQKATLLTTQSQSSIPMLAPLTWAPAAQAQSTDDDQVLGLSVSWVDLSESQQLEATLGTLPQVNALQWGLGYRYNRLQPRLSINVAQFERSQPIDYITWRDPIDEIKTVMIRDRLTRLNLGTQYYLINGQNSFIFSFAYEATWGRVIHRSLLNLDPLNAPPYIPMSSFIASGNFGLTLSNISKPPFAIATEYGGSLSLYHRLYHPILGGDIQRSSIFLNASYHWQLPLKHSLYILSYTSYSRGDRGRLLTYQLTRPPQQSIIWSALTAEESSNLFLRGYPQGTLVGSPLGLLTLAYRMPIFSWFRGAATVPLFFKQLGLSIWSDLGWLAPTDRFLSDTEWKRSAGIELYQAWLAFWRLPIKIRLGVGYGFDKPGEAQVYLMLGHWN